MNNHSSDERLARLEGINERVLYELGDIKADVRHSHAELKSEIQLNRAEMLAMRTELKSEIAESRVEARESVKDSRDSIKELRSDFRWMLGAQLTSTLALVALMVRGFGWM